MFERLFTHFLLCVLSHQDIYVLTNDTRTEKVFFRVYMVVICVHALELIFNLVEKEEWVYGTSTVCLHYVLV